MGQEMGGRFKREGTCVYTWLIHADVWQKSQQYYKAIILQLKIKIFKKGHQHVGLACVCSVTSVVSDSLQPRGL